METIITLLLLLQIKHWFFDFAYQTEDELMYKGVYGHCYGVTHSIKHGVGTFCCLLIMIGFKDVPLAAILGFFDFIIHYHIDYLKMNYGCSDITKSKFWNHLGLDQMAHQLTYIFITYLMLLNSVT